MRTRMFDGGRRFRRTLLVAVSSSLWLVPAASWAQKKKGGDEPTLFATLKLYEVQEGTDLKGRADDPVLRLANAALVGTATGGLCTAGQDPCAFDTLAKSEVLLDKGVGPLRGTFQVLFDTNASGTHLLSDLVLVASGSVDGKLDLTPILNQTAPVAFIRDGKWKSGSLGLRGTFTGAFLLPFPDPTGGCATGFAYLDPSAGVHCLTGSEMSLGRPVTKVLATFLKAGSFGPKDPDDDDAEDRGRN